MPKAWQSRFLEDQSRLWGVCFVVDAVSVSPGALAMGLGLVIYDGSSVVCDAMV